MYLGRCIYCLEDIQHVTIFKAHFHGSFLLFGCNILNWMAVFYFHHLLKPTEDTAVSCMLQAEGGRVGWYFSAILQLERCEENKRSPLILLFLCIFLFWKKQTKQIWSSDYSLSFHTGHGLDRKSKIKAAVLQSCSFCFEKTCVLQWIRGCEMRVKWLKKIEIGLDKHVTKTFAQGRIPVSVFFFFFQAAALQ